MSDTLVLLKRTVFLPKGSPGIYEISNLKVDIRNPQISSADGKTLCTGDADLLLEYMALEDAGDISRSIWQEQGDATPPIKPWQALLTLPFETLAQGEFSCPPLCQVGVRDVKWYVIAPRALELEFKLVIKPSQEEAASLESLGDAGDIIHSQEVFGGYEGETLYPGIYHGMEMDIRQSEAVFAPRNLGEKVRQEPRMPSPESKMPKPDYKAPKPDYKAPKPKYKEPEPIIPPKEIPPAPVLPREELPKPKPMPEKVLPEIIIPEPKKEPEPCPVEPREEVKPAPCPVEPREEVRPTPPCPVEPPSKVRPFPPCPRELPEEEPEMPVPKKPKREDAPQPFTPPQTRDKEARWPSCPPSQAQGDYCERPRRTYNLRLCRVLPGDDINSVAQRSGVSPSSLAARNKISGEQLPEGMYLIIP